jgi:hypothetical protein
MLTDLSQAFSEFGNVVDVRYLSICVDLFLLSN